MRLERACFDATVGRSTGCGGGSKLSQYVGARHHQLRSGVELVDEVFAHRPLHLDPPIGVG
jgi:hypothetical protein